MTVTLLQMTAAMRAAMSAAIGGRTCEFVERADRFAQLAKEFVADQTETCVASVIREQQRLRQREVELREIEAKRRAVRAERDAQRRAKVGRGKSCAKTR